jgi:transketolase
MVTLEEHTVDGGLGGAVAEVLLESGVSPRRFQRIGLRRGFSTVVGSQTYLRQAYGLDEDSVCRTVEELLGAVRHTEPR